MVFIKQHHANVLPFRHFSKGDPNRLSQYFPSRRTEKKHESYLLMLNYKWTLLNYHNPLNYIASNIFNVLTSISLRDTPFPDPLT